jgi:high-affinity iron transporter
MLPSYLLSLREGLEAALIVGILLGALRQMRQPEFAPAVAAGALGAAAMSIVIAVVLSTLGMELEAPGEAIFEGFMMLIAAGLLTWMIFWMNRQGRFMRSRLEAEVHSASRVGKRAIFFVAFTAVLREGIELAIFLTASVFATNAQQTLLGGFLGLGTAILLGWSIFATIVRLDLGRFFQVTSLLLILFAAGLVVHGAHEFTEVGWLPPLIDPIWDATSVVPPTSWLGQLLTALFGYNPTPSLAEMIAYVLYFVGVGAGFVLANQKPRQKAPAQA